MANAVYDDEKERFDLPPGIEPGPGVSGEHDNLGMSEDDRASEVKNLEDQFGQSGDDASEGSTIKPDKLNEAESTASTPADSPAGGSGGGNQRGGLYKSDSQGSKSKVSGKSKSSSKGTRNAIVAAFAAGTLLVSTFGILAFLPTLAIKHIMKNLQGTFNDRLEYAVQTREQVYLQKYVQKLITPSIPSCGTTISRNCSAFDPGTGIMGRLFKTWHDNRIELKLYEKYGVEFKYNSKTNKTEILKFGTVVGESGARTIAKDVMPFLENETQSAGVRERWITRSLLSRKYKASKWCILACQARDNFGNINLTAKRKIELKLINLIVKPMNAKASAYLMCFVLDCGDDVAKVLEKGESAAAKSIASGLEDGALKQIAEDIGDKTLKQYLLEKVLTALLEPLLGQAAAEVAVSAVPLVGQIYAVLTLSAMIYKIDQKLANNEISQFIKSVNESAYAEYYALWGVMDNEIQSGETSLADVGAAVDMFKGFDQSRVYQKMIGGGGLPTVQCDDNVTLSGQDAPLACPEKSVQPRIAVEVWRASPTGQAFASLYAWMGDNAVCAPVAGCATFADIILPILHAISWTLGKISGFVVDLFSLIPGVSDLMTKITNFIGDKANEFFSWLMTKLFKQAVNLNASGQEAFDQTAAGIDVTTNSMLKGEQTDDGFIGMGAPRISEADQVVLDNVIKEQKAEQWKSQSVFARFFDPSVDGSVVDKALTNMAFNIPTLKSNFFSINVFNSIGNLFSSIFMPRTHAAILANRGAIFGVTQYGFPVDSTALTIDPALLTDANCASIKAARDTENIGWTIDQETKEKIYLIADPCALDDVVTQSLAKIYDLDVAGASQ